MLSRNLKIGLLIGLGLLLFYLIKTYTDKSPQYTLSDRMTESEMVMLEEGDLIMRRGFGLVSTFILNLLDEKIAITHIGILTKKDEKWHVAHSLSNNYAPKDGVQLQELKDFIADSYEGSILITRLKKIDESQRNAISMKLESYIEREIPFDHHFNYKDTTAFYCSELPLNILVKDLKLLKFESDMTDKEKYHSLSPFYNDKYFDIIINHHQ